MPSSSSAFAEAMASFEEQRMRELSLEDPSSPCINVSVSSSSSLSMEEIWQNIQHRSRFSVLPPPHHATLTLSRDAATNSSSSSFSHFRIRRESSGNGALPGDPLRRARQHLNAFDLVSTLEFLIEEAPASAPELQHYQEALGVQQRKRLKCHNTGNTLRKRCHGRYPNNKVCHYKTILTEAVAEQQLNKEFEGGGNSSSDA